MAQIDGGRPCQPEQRPAEPERDHAEHRDEDVAEDHRDRQHDEVDQERKHPPRQHAAEQFRLQIGIERMRLHPAVIAPGAAGIARTAVRHDRPPRPILPCRTWERAVRVPRACDDDKPQYSGDSGRRSHSVVPAKPRTHRAIGYRGGTTSHQHPALWSRRSPGRRGERSSAPPSASPPPSARNRSECRRRRRA